MAWNTILSERLRYLVGDLDPSNYIWTDSQLEKFLAISAITVLNDLSRYNLTSFTISTESTGYWMIQPDLVDNVDPGVSNLVVIAAACVIGRAAYNKLIAQGAGWKVTDDRSTIDGAGALSATKKGTDDYCQTYKDILLQYKNGNRYAGSAVLSPYASSDGNPRHGRGWNYRDTI